MNKPLQVMALIPARSGSKSVVNKNIRNVAGKPLMAWSIEQALKARRVDRVIVSTDSDDYAKLACRFGAEVPFIRPQKISGDAATDLEVFEHALNWLKDHENYTPDICIHLRPTCPLRNVTDIDAVVDILTTHNDIDSVRTVTPVLHPPYKMWTRSEEGQLLPVAHLDNIQEPWNEPRQKLPQSYIQTANIDAVRTSVILEQHSMTGTRIHGYMDAGLNDIDEEHELKSVALMLSRMAKTPNDHPVHGNNQKTFCFDIDGVIATITKDNDYNLAKPRHDMIDQINRLYATGHKIILLTARGYATGIDWKKTTAEQMDEWGVNHHELHFGKPAADYYIDDKMVPMDKIVKM
jgi:CMP-N,N'-diacetyllegionaminic acid synthase